MNKEKKLFLEQCKRACRFLNEDVDEESQSIVDDEAPVAEEIDDESDEDNEKVPCPTCDGTGVIVDEDGNETECPTCGGTGEVDIDDTDFDFDPADGTCPCCGAHLNVIEPEMDSLAGEDDLDNEDDELDESVNPKDLRKHLTLLKLKNNPELIDSIVDDVVDEYPSKINLNTLDFDELFDKFAEKLADAVDNEDELDDEENDDE